MTDEQTIIRLRETNAALQELVAEITNRADRLRALLVGMLQNRAPDSRDIENIFGAIAEYDNLVREA